MPSPPDLIVCGAGAFGADGAEAVVVRDGRIEAVTTRREALATRGSSTRVIDAPRGLVCPGFHDAHAHLVALGSARREIDLHGLDVAGIAAAVRAAAAGRESGGWLVGRGYDPEVFRQSPRTARDILDEAAPDVAVVLRSHDYHSAALNTSALIDAQFYPPGRADYLEGIDRDALRRLTGILREEAALYATTRAECRTHEEFAAVAEAALPEFHRAGVTALHDMSGSRYHPALRALDGADRLTLDVYATIGPHDTGIKQLRAPGRALSIVGMKAFLDGALGSRTAHLLEPYEGEAAHRGLEVLRAEDARRAVREAADVGLPSFLHAIGDAAVRTALDALENVRDPGGAPLPHRVEHAQMIHDDDLPRFARAGVAASMQPVHLALDAPLVHRHWGGRAREAFPARRLLDSGAVVAFGSDAPIETCDVLEGIRFAVGRRGRDGTALAPSEAVTPAEALAAYTTGAAHSIGLANATGSLRPGLPANVTLLSEDVAARPESLADAAVLATIWRGRVVFDGGLS